MLQRERPMLAWNTVKGKMLLLIFGVLLGLVIRMSVFRFYFSMPLTEAALLALPTVILFTIASLMVRRVKGTFAHLYGKDPAKDPSWAPTLALGPPTIMIASGIAGFMAASSYIDAAQGEFVLSVIGAGVAVFLTTCGVGIIYACRNLARVHSQT